MSFFSVFVMGCEASPSRVMPLAIGTTVPYPTDHLPCEHDWTLFLWRLAGDRCEGGISLVND
jgi:hypothetical protein